MDMEVRFVQVLGQFCLACRWGTCLSTPLGNNRLLDLDLLLLLGYKVVDYNYGTFESLNVVPTTTQY